MRSGEILEFPCDFPLKVFGENRPDFEAAVVAVVRRHAPDLGEGAVRGRASRNGRYLALTVTVRAKSRDQLDALYAELKDHELVTMVL